MEGMETNQTLKRKLLAPAMAIILAIALTTGCEDLRPKDNWPGLIDASATDVGENYAEIEVSTVLESNAVRKVGIEYGTSSSLGYATEMSGAHISLTALQSGTRYYYRPYVKDYMGNLYNGLQIKSFNTKEKPV
ncbi:MAG: hypothetical protein LBJ58_06565, partial [Tannerellaceae bacterium]|nr:hypothetical protein [Tannerellaceae bacterium]